MTKVETLKLINKLIHFTENTDTKSDLVQKELSDLMAKRQGLSDEILRDLTGETLEEEPVEGEYEVTATWAMVGITVIKATSLGEAEEVAWDLKPHNFQLVETRDNHICVTNIEHLTSKG